MSKTIPFLPASRPKLQRDAAILRMARAGFVLKGNTVAVGGIRGYYHDDNSSNKRGIYDDCIFIVGPEHFSTYNGNTDPSAWKKGVATLKPGIHPYRPGWHRKGQAGGHKAFRPDTPGEKLPVTRDGVTVPLPGIAINIHRGGWSGTSSLGCQTIYPSQWDAFYSTLMDQLSRAGQTTFNFVLI